MNLIAGEEEAVAAFRRLCESRGYRRYRMNKFEEYDLYVRHKDFLVSDSVITFTDTGGKLMALKPDVTLSIIKNGRDVPGELQKVYYNEKVYRISRRTRSFREITQVGLEAIGEVDEYTLYEVLRLACDSLRAVSPEYLLDISELDIIRQTVDMLGAPAALRGGILKCIGEKNLHEIRKICASADADPEVSRLLVALIECEGSPSEAIGRIRSFPASRLFAPRLDRLERITSLLDRAGLGDRISVDLSVINDMNYYSGIVFSGFVPGIPDRILSGGQYDRLMQKMDRKCGAVGFAIYLDMLELTGRSHNEPDADVVLLYDKDASPGNIQNAAEALGADGARVLVLKKLPDGLRYGKLARLTGEGVRFYEGNA